VASNPTPVQSNTEEFWEDLLAYIRSKRVIPVIGAELLTIVDNGQRAPLYRVVAERLLKKYGFSTSILPSGEVLREHHELNDAVCALASTGRRIKDLYPRILDILNNVLGEQKEIPQPLQEIASIRDFDLFITTTPDNLLVQALNAERFSGTDLVHEIEYAPNLPLDRERDIPESRLPSYAAVFYLFGKADVGPFYAIHDEDALEFPYMLLSKGPERMFHELQNRHLLLIGCSFYDWLSRFFIRLSNSVRLSVDRDKQEFLVGEETAGDANLTIFLKRFSHDSHCYPGDASAFVTELHRRWSALPRPASVLFLPQKEAAAPEPGILSGSVFLSYAHEDVVAARTLFTDLQAIGSDVAWFDKTQLKPGDIWDSQITGAIDRCRVFLPLLSASSEERDEGYFEREWNRAADRCKGMIGRKFIFPIVIDADYADDMTRYNRVPDIFKTLQYNHAPCGHMSDVLKEELTRQLRVLRRAKAI
jgi:TIR domain